MTLGNDEAVNGWPEPKYRSKEVGVATYLYASFDQNLSGKTRSIFFLAVRANVTAYNGRYLADCAVADPYNETIRPWACSKVEATKLWKWTENLLGLKFTQ